MNPSMSLSDLPASLIYYFVYHISYITDHRFDDSPFQLAGIGKGGGGVGVLIRDYPYEGICK